jgi:outer membrane protein, multidrug efflux system
MREAGDRRRTRSTRRRAGWVGRASRVASALLAAAAVLVGAVLVGCAVGPDYHRPATAVDGQFANAGEPGLVAGEPAERYWTTFNDPMLTELVEVSIAHNTDLQAATANLQVARAARRLTGFDQFPTVTFSGQYAKVLESGQELPGYSFDQREFDTAQAGFDGLWELDLFGRVRRNVQAARADVEASEATLRDARVSVVAEVARDSFILRGLQDELALTRRNAENQDSSVKHDPDARGVDPDDHLQDQRADRPASHRARGRAFTAAKTS